MLDIDQNPDQTVAVALRVMRNDGDGTVRAAAIALASRAASSAEQRAAVNAALVEKLQPEADPADFSAALKVMQRDSRARKLLPAIVVAALKTSADLQVQADALSYLVDQAPPFNARRGSQDYATLLPALMRAMDNPMLESRAKHACLVLVNRSEVTSPAAVTAVAALASQRGGELELRLRACGTLGRMGQTSAPAVLALLREATTFDGEPAIISSCLRELRALQSRAAWTVHELNKHRGSGRLSRELRAEFDQTVKALLE